ncbi:MAG: hypothetical protein V4508_25335 [Pseudomonadota bacterium]
MSALLIVHICTGTIAVLSGAGALWTSKGGPRHRVFGTVFLISMLFMGAFGAYMAYFLPQIATVAVAILTCYLVTTGWTAARNRRGTISLFDKGLIAIPLIVAACLVAGGLQAQRSPTGSLQGVPYAAYFIFASFALLTAVGDVSMIMRGSLSGMQRTCRHLWRMCVALLFAVNIFFGQEKVLPKFVHDSPLLMVLKLAPLVLMIYWLVRIRFPKRYKTPVAEKSSN